MVSNRIKISLLMVSWVLFYWEKQKKIIPLLILTPPIVNRFHTKVAFGHCKKNIYAFISLLTWDKCYL